MSEKVAIRLIDVGKMYKMFLNRLDSFLDSANLTSIFPWRKVKAQEFWALRDINLEIESGKRIGIIGRNGAGKSTLLKLLTQNKIPTEGTVEVNGQVQALLEAGAGFHPEFTGYENIRASLIYQGMQPDQIDAAIQDIEEFTELGQFFAQPFKTYSAGMQARLTFATATVLNPDILIVDEILGAGDAYFAGKSMERMKRLVEDSGATVLIVSHALDQILRYCDECVWLERGRIVKRGPALEVVKAYEQFIRVLDDRRLKAKNHKRISREYNPDQYDIFGDNLVVRFTWAGQPGTYFDVSSVRLLKDSEVEDEIRVGDSQDINPSHSGFVILDNSDWSQPQKNGGILFRRLGVQPSKVNYNSGVAFGNVVFYMYALFPSVAYAVDFKYRCNCSEQLFIEFWKNGNFKAKMEIPSNAKTWVTHRVPVEFLSEPFSTSIKAIETLSPDITDSRSEEVSSVSQKDVARQEPSSKTERMQSRWPGEGSLVIEQVAFLDAENCEQGVFQVGTPLNLSIKFVARKYGVFRIIPCAVLFRTDGIMVSQFIDNPVELHLEQGETREIRLEYGPLELGDGNYVFSVALYRKLDFTNLEQPETYDLIDRSFEFNVFGNPPLLTALIHHPGKWRVV